MGTGGFYSAQFDNFAIHGAVPLYLLIIIMIILPALIMTLSVIELTLNAHEI